MAASSGLPLEGCGTSSTDEEREPEPAIMSVCVVGGGRDATGGQAGEGRQHPPVVRRFRVPIILFMPSPFMVTPVLASSLAGQEGEVV